MVREMRKAAASSPDAPAPRSLLSNKPLTGKERKKAMEELPDKYRQFLEDVEPIITDLERDTLLRLTSDYQRDHFVDEFWKRRSFIARRTPGPVPGHLGAPRSAGVGSSSGTSRATGRASTSSTAPPTASRRWTARTSTGRSSSGTTSGSSRLRLSKVYLLFYQQFGVGDYRLWTPTDGAQALIPGNMAGIAAPGGRRVDVTRCGDYRDVQRALSTSAAMFGTIGRSMKMVDDLSSGEKPGYVEGVDAILQMTTDVPPDATPLMVQRTLRFPEMFGNKMRVELALLLEREALATKTMGEETFFDIDVVGEIVKGDRLIDNFRYRFDFPASSVSGPFLPLNDRAGPLPRRVPDQGEGGRREPKRGRPHRRDARRSPTSPTSSLTAQEKAAREAGRQAVARLVAEAGEPKGRS